MKIIRSLEEWTDSASLVATLGTFDGIHLGHQFILNELKRIAQAQNAKSLLISLHPHPRIVLNPSAPTLLLQTLEEKIQSLENQGIDYLLLLPFTPTIAQLSAENFLKDLLFRKLPIQTLLIGFDHRFGKNREGNFQLLQTIAQQLHKQVIQLPEFLYNGQKVSSTIIRNAILEGNIAKANELLGRPFSLSGKVIPGDQRGKTLGFPTANLQIQDPHKIIPNFGVYICRAILPSQQTLPAVTNIGTRPTFHPSHTPQIETHILDFQQDLYHQNLTLQFLHKIRPEKKFSSPQELKQQIQQDIETTRNYFKITTI